MQIKEYNNDYRGNVITITRQQMMAAVVGMGIRECVRSKEVKNYRKGRV